MKFSFQKLALGLSAAILLAATVESGAFALLGPVQPWMQATNGVILPGDIGGPMCISNGYRWNVPVLTYGFDQSFLDFFGTNGVAAVEGAIQILNALPPASQMVLTNYPFDSRNLNYTAEAQSLFDLKTQTLSLLLEHLGLAQPTRNVYVLHDWNPGFFAQPLQDLDITIYGMPISYEEDPNGFDPGAYAGHPGYITNFVAGFNFDPETFEPSAFINNTAYAGTFGYEATGLTFIQTFAPDPSAHSYSAVADFSLDAGVFDNEINDGGLYYCGLTRDDVGGLCHLLSTNNANYETLLPGIAGVGINSHSFVNGAWRPGVDKITFIPQPVDAQSGTFLPTTNYFTDSYLTNGVLNQQQLARVISQPDFLFSAGDVTLGIPVVPFFARTGTTNWLNNATANGNTNGAGPGLIQPPVQIVFNKLGRQLASDSYTSENQAVDFSQFWGSFDGSTNAPVVYPISQTVTNQMTVRMRLAFAGNQQESFVWKSFVWKPASLAGAQFAMQTSTNLVAWTTLFALTNNGSVCTYFNDNPASLSRFYRLIQP